MNDDFVAWPLDVNTQWFSPLVQACVLCTAFSARYVQRCSGFHQMLHHELSFDMFFSSWRSPWHGGIQHVESCQQGLAADQDKFQPFVHEVHLKHSPGTSWIGDAIAELVEWRSRARRGFSYLLLHGSFCNQLVTLTLQKIRAARNGEYCLR